MKKQLIIVGAVLLCALLAFGVYEIFFNGGKIVVETDPFYTLTDTVKAEIEKVDEKVDIVFSVVSQTKVTNDEILNRAYKYAVVYNITNKKIKVSFDESGSYYGIIIKKDGGSKQISFDELYKSKEEGTKYAFDGERLYTNAILSLCGKNEIANIELRALDGFDIYGNTVTSTGKPFMYPNITRSDVLSISVTSKNGNYMVYRATNDKFYFEGAEIVSYNEELFASLVVSSTYVVATKIVKNPKELSVYGLDSDANATGTITVYTLNKVTHKIIIGKKTSDGLYYYAKYDGKDIIYLLEASGLDSPVLGPVTKYFTANLVNGITKTDEVFKVNNIVLDLYDEGYTLKALVHAQMFVSSNLSAYGDAVLATLYTNKINYNGNNYTNWTEIPTLGGFTSSDGKPVYLEVPLANYGSVGDYTVSFGLLRDETNYAFMPDGISAQISTDGKSYTDIDIGNMAFSQDNKVLKNYSFNFHSDVPVLFVRVYFQTKSGNCIVLDELTVKVDGIDAHPNDGVIGGWKLTAPAEYIPEGKLFIYPNADFPTSFITSIATLVGESVVDYGITTDRKAETIIQEKLMVYGLDTPSRHFAFEYNGVTTDVYFSHINENGKYYCYSTISGESDGQVVKYCTDIIAEVNPVTVTWLGWDMVDYVDQTIFSMYIDTIDTLTLSFEGKDYAFNFEKGDDGKLSRVTIDNKEVDLKQFRYLYVSMLSMSLKGEYIESEETAAEVLKIKIKSNSKSPEIVFYRVSTIKAYYTVDGVGSNYVLIDSINTIKTNLGLLLEGKEVPN